MSDSSGDSLSIEEFQRLEMRKKKKKKKKKISATKIRRQSLSTKKAKAIEDGEPDQARDFDDDLEKKKNNKKKNNKKDNNKKKKKKRSATEIRRRSSLKTKKAKKISKAGPTETDIKQDSKRGRSNSSSAAHPPPSMTGREMCSTSWICARCTLINEESAISCRACGAYESSIPDTVNAKGGGKDARLMAEKRETTDTVFLETEEVEFEIEVEGKLNPIQRDGIEFMRRSEENESKRLTGKRDSRGKFIKGRIIASRMGSGKTLLVLAHIIKRIREQNQSGINFDKEGKVTSFSSRATLVITPRKITHQWESECRRHFSPKGAIKVLRINRIVDCLKLTIEKACDAHLIILSANIFKRGHFSLLTYELPKFQTLNEDEQMTYGDLEEIFDCEEDEEYLPVMDLREPMNGREVDSLTGEYKKYNEGELFYKNNDEKSILILFKKVKEKWMCIKIKYTQNQQKVCYQKTLATSRDPYNGDWKWKKSELRGKLIFSPGRQKTALENTEDWAVPVSKLSLQNKLFAFQHLRFRRVVIDEVHEVLAGDDTRSNTILDFVDKIGADFRYAISATPCTNSVQNRKLMEFLRIQNEPSRFLIIGPSFPDGIDPSKLTKEILVKKELCFEENIDDKTNGHREYLMHQFPQPNIERKYFKSHQVEKLIQDIELKCSETLDKKKSKGKKERAKKLKKNATKLSSLLEINNFFQKEFSKSDCDKYTDYCLTVEDMESQYPKMIQFYISHLSKLPDTDEYSALKENIDIWKDRKKWFTKLWKEEFKEEFAELWKEEVSTKKVSIGHGCEDNGVVLSSHGSKILEVVREIVHLHSTEPSARIAIYSRHYTLSKKVSELLDRYACINVGEAKGTAAQCEKVLKSFQTTYNADGKMLDVHSVYKVILLPPDGIPGANMNLLKYIFLLDPRPTKKSRWEFKEAQAIGRALRQDMKIEEIKFYRFISEHKKEEKTSAQKSSKKPKQSEKRRRDDAESSSSGKRQKTQAANIQKPERGGTESLCPSTKKWENNLEDMKVPTSISITETYNYSSGASNHPTDEDIQDAIKKEEKEAIETLEILKVKGEDWDWSAPVNHFAYMPHLKQLAEKSQEKQNVKEIKVAFFGRPQTGKSMLTNYLIYGENPLNEDKYKKYFLAQSEASGRQDVGLTTFICKWTYVPNLEHPTITIEWKDHGRKRLESLKQTAEVGKEEKRKIDELLTTDYFDFKDVKEPKELVSELRKIQDRIKAAFDLKNTDQKGNSYEYLDSVKCINIKYGPQLYPKNGPKRDLGHEKRPFGISREGFVLYDLPGYPDARANTQKASQIRSVIKDIDILFVICQAGKNDFKPLAECGIFEEREPQSAPLRLVFCTNSFEGGPGIAGREAIFKDVWGHKMDEGRRQLRDRVLGQAQNDLKIRLIASDDPNVLAAGTPAAPNLEDDTGEEDLTINQHYMDEILSKAEFILFLISETPEFECKDGKWYATRDSEGKINEVCDGICEKKYFPNPESSHNKLSYDTAEMIKQLFNRSRKDLKTFYQHLTLAHLKDALTAADGGISTILRKSIIRKNAHNNMSIARPKNNFDEDLDFDFYDGLIFTQNEQSIKDKLQELAQQNVKNIATQFCKLSKGNEEEIEVQRKAALGLIENILISQKHFAVPSSKGPRRKSKRYSMKKLVKIFKIGSGGFGKVFLCRSTGDDDTTFAVKYCELKPNKKRKPFEKTFDREVEILNNMGEYGPKFYGKIEELHDGSLAYAMEYCSAGDLKSFRKWYYQNKRNSSSDSSNSMKDSIIKHIIWNIAEGTKQLKKIGYVHCDIKLENILLRTDGSVLLTDFGGCQKVGTTTKKIVWSDGFIPTKTIREANIMNRVKAIEFRDIYAITRCILLLKRPNSVAFVPYYDNDAKCQFNPRTVDKKYLRLPEGTDKNLVDLFNKYKSSIVDDIYRTETIENVMEHPFFADYHDKGEKSGDKKPKNQKSKKEEHKEEFSKLVQEYVNNKHSKTILDLSKSVTKTLKELESIGEEVAKKAGNHLLDTITSDVKFDQELEDLQKTEDFDMSEVKDRLEKAKESFFYLEQVVDQCRNKLKNVVEQFWIKAKENSFYTEQVDDESNSKLKMLDKQDIRVSKILRTLGIKEVKALDLYEIQEGIKKRVYDDEYLNLKYLVTRFQKRSHKLTKSRRRFIWDASSYPKPKLVDRHMTNRALIPPSREDQNAYNPQDDIDTSEAYDFKHHEYNDRILNKFNGTDLLNSLKQLRKGKKLKVDSFYGRKRKNKKNKTIDKADDKIKAGLDLLFYGLRRCKPADLCEYVEREYVERENANHEGISVIVDRINKKIIMRYSKETETTIEDCIRSCNVPTPVSKSDNQRAQKSKLGLYPILYDYSVKKTEFNSFVQNLRSEGNLLNYLLMCFYEENSEQKPPSMENVVPVRYSCKAGNEKDSFLTYHMKSTLMQVVAEGLKIPSAFLIRGNVSQVQEYNSNPGFRCFETLDSSMQRSLMFMQMIHSSQKFPESEMKKRKEFLMKGSSRINRWVNRLTEDEEIADDVYNALDSTRLNSNASNPTSLCNTLQQIIEKSVSEKSEAEEKAAAGLKEVIESLKSDARIGYLSLDSEAISSKRTLPKKILNSIPPGTHWIQASGNLENSSVNCSSFLILEEDFACGLYPVSISVLLENLSKENVQSLEECLKKTNQRNRKNEAICRDVQSPAAIESVRLGIERASSMLKLVHLRSIILHGVGCAELTWWRTAALQKFE